MEVKYNTKKSEATIKLSWTEIRQFLSDSTAVKAVQSSLEAAIEIEGGDFSILDTDCVL